MKFGLNKKNLQIQIKIQHKDQLAFFFLAMLNGFVIFQLCTINS